MEGRIAVIGAGITGITLAERLASFGNKVMLYEKRDHIGGNCYDEVDSNGILIQKYGPHIFHTNSVRVWDYLSKFTDWINYEHKVLGHIDGKYVPIPFNLSTLHQLLPYAAPKLGKKLIDTFGLGARVPILELRNSGDADLKKLSDYIYEKVFLHYNKKQWGVKPENIDPEVSGRVPVVIDQDDRYFSDRYQAIPRGGYCGMFKKMVCNGNIKVVLGSSFNKAAIDTGGFKTVFYTGPIDEFFDYELGKLDYRKVLIDFETYDLESFQPAAVVNYPGADNLFTRITEFKKLTGQNHSKTVTGTEYPGEQGFEAWPVLNGKNKELFGKYCEKKRNLPKNNFHFIGRLAEYKYYDMDDAVENVLRTVDKIYG